MADVDAILLAKGLPRPGAEPLRGAWCRLQAAFMTGLRSTLRRLRRKMALTPEQADQIRFPCC